MLEEACKNKDKNNMMGISFVDLSGQTEDSSQLSVGVSNRFDSDEFREMTRKRLMGASGAHEKSPLPSAESVESTETIRETSAKMICK